MIPPTIDYFPAVNSSATMPPKMRPQTVQQSQKSRDSTQTTHPLSQGRIEALRVLSLALSKQISALSEFTAAADPTFTLADEVRRFEADMIRVALVQTNGGQRRAARLLGMKITTLHRKIKHYKINIAEVKSEAELLHITEK